MSDPTLLAKATDRLSNFPGFIAFELGRYRRLTQVDPGDDFGLSADSLRPLALCRMPRRDEYITDIKAISARVGAPTYTVANFLRGIDAVTILASRTDTARVHSMARGMLTAARDLAEEYTEFEAASSGDLRLPGWLSQAVERFWGHQEATATFPRDLYLPILLNLPVAIIEIDELTVGSLNDWLQRRRLPHVAETADRPLRGCLTAYAGVGILFVDRSDDPDQQRLTVAHEAGHFLTDYLIPREEVIRRRPDLLAVVDGDRAPTNSERFDALLADVPIDLHTHLLTRDSRGGHLSDAAADVEDRAERLALELLAPLRFVLRETAATGVSDPQALLQARFGLPSGVAMRYANHIQRLRPQTPKSLFEVIGLTEQRDTSHSPGTEQNQEPGT